MDPKRADPSHELGQVLEDHSRKWRTATLGSRHSPRLTMRAPRTADRIATPDHSSSRFLLGIFVPIAGLFLLALIAKNVGPASPPVQGPLEIRVWSQSTSCTVTENGALIGSARLTISDDPAVRERVQSNGLRLWWTGRAGELFAESRSVAATDLVEISITDIILPAGSLDGTPELLRCGVRVELP